MSLATTDDLEARLGRDLTADELARSAAVLSDVSDSVILYTGQKFERDTYLLRTRVKRGFVRLPQRPVHDVDAVTDRFENDVAFTFDGIDRVYIDCYRSGCAPIQVVDITYDAGPDAVPAAIVGVACSIALRTLGTDPTEAAKTREAIDGYSYSIGSAGGAGSYGLLPDEYRILRSYRRVGGSMRVGL